jgi:hypothetical protein
VLITLSTAFVLAVIALALIWAKKVSIGAALLVWLSGFTLAGTGLAAPVNAFIATVLTAVHH